MAIGEACYCADGTPNTGLPNCPATIKKTVGKLMTPKYATDGTRNYLDISSSTIIGLNALLTNADTSKRVYPVIGYKDVTIDPTDPTFKTYGDDAKSFVRNGIYTFMGTLIEKMASAPMVQALNSVDCDTWSFYGVTSDGKVWGEVDLENGRLYPIEWTGFFAQGLFANDEQRAEIKVQFDLDSEFNYGKLYQLDSALFDVNPLQAKGLINVNATMLAAPTTTGVSVKLMHPYGEGTTSQNVSGLVLADFLVENVTTGLTITPTSVTEVPNVSYDFVWAAQTSADVIKISLVQSSTKMEGSVTGITA